jgi:hypothetical protein
VVNIPDDAKKRTNIGFEHINQSISDESIKKTPVVMARSKTFDETLTNRSTDNDENVHTDSKQSANELSKQRFKRRGRNRPSSPLPPTDYQMTLSTQTKPEEINAATNSTSITNQKRKKILRPQSNLNLSSSSATTSSSQSLDEGKHRAAEERRQQREERQKELVRFRRSQEIQRELDELEQKRIELEKRHALARQNLGKKCPSLRHAYHPSIVADSCANNEVKRSYWERECLCLVRERTTLQRREEELSMAKRGLTLEDERVRAENEYRQLISRSGRVPQAGY